MPGETIFPDLRAGRVAKCENCLKKLAEASKVGKKRKRAGVHKSGRESSGSSTGRKQKYSEDSSADEDENVFQEAGIMKVCES